MGWVARLMGTREEPMMPLYAAVVARARAPHWYVAGAVPDTVDGRFDMVAAVLATVLIRLEDEAAGAVPAVRLAERFVDDMDGQLREIGIGDVVVGKHVGKMMSMLGGRLGAYRAALSEGGDLPAALRRNLYRGDEPASAAIAHVAAALTAQYRALCASPLAPLVEGRLP